MGSEARCLVFGGSGGIGAEICRSLHPNARVACTYHQGSDRAAKLVAELPGLVSIPCDLRSPGRIREAVVEAAEALGGLTAIIMATGADTHALFKKIGEVSTEDLDDLFAVNTRGVFLALQAGVPALKKSGGGNIVVLGSMDGIKPIPSPVHFAASKAALRGLVEALSKEVGGDGIRVNLVAPGIVEGPSTVTLPAKVREDYLKYCSTGRFARRSEVADLVAWLALENTYVTGQCLLLDGGL